MTSQDLVDRPASDLAKLLEDGLIEEYGLHRLQAISVTVGVKAVLKAEELRAAAAAAAAEAAAAAAAADHMAQLLLVRVMCT